MGLVTAPTQYFINYNMSFLLLLCPTIIRNVQDALFVLYLLW